MASECSHGSGGKFFYGHHRECVDCVIERLTRERDEAQEETRCALVREVEWARLLDEARAEIDVMSNDLTDMVARLKQARAEVARLQAIVGNPDTYEALLMGCQVQAQAAQEARAEAEWLRKGVEAYRDLMQAEDGEAEAEAILAWEREDRERSKSDV